MIGDYIFLITEWIGTVSFAISGSLVAIAHGLDLFGVLIVGCVTAVGGGITRDILMGNIPPRIFFDPVVLSLAVITSLLVFLIAAANARKFTSFRKKLENVNIFFDALGLAVFSVSGVEAACSKGFEDNAVFAITLGVITGVGGGVLRDVFVNEKPYILTKHIYAVASIAGCGVYLLFRELFELKVWGIAVSVILTVIIRLLAAHFRWKLPKIRLPEEEKNEKNSR